MHGFADASKQAYGAAIYLRVILGSSVEVTFQLAKTRVAPIKTLSLPRLELCAAHTLARLVLHYISNMPVVVNSVHLWSDSTDVLCWLKDHPSRWETFVANRCSDIHTLVPNACWHHVKSSDNAADPLSRGVNPLEFASCHLWWHGPKPKTSQVEPVIVHLNEQNECFKGRVWDLVDKYSDLSKLLRITTYCLRFIGRVKLRIQRANDVKVKLLRSSFVSYLNSKGSIATFSEALENQANLINKFSASVKTN